MLVICVCLLALRGCSDERKTPHLAGHYYMLTREGEVEILMTGAHKMRETVYPTLGTSRALEGTWMIEGDHIVFSPFLALGAQGIQAQTIWRARAEYDLNGDLQVLAYEGRSLYFQREHQFYSQVPHLRMLLGRSLVIFPCEINERSSRLFIERSSGCVALASSLGVHRA